MSGYQGLGIGTFAQDPTPGRLPHPTVPPGSKYVETINQVTTTLPLFTVSCALKELFPSSNIVGVV